MSILNKYSLMAKICGPEAVWFGKELTSPGCKKECVMKCYAGPKREENTGILDFKLSPCSECCMLSSG